MTEPMKSTKGQSAPFCKKVSIAYCFRACDLTILHLGSELYFPLISSK